jgi:hypothetical protein
MENFYENFLQEIENGTAADHAAKQRSSVTKNVTELHGPEKNLRASGTEIWRAILADCKQVPEPLRHAFVIQVLVSILDDQEISIERLHGALRQAFEAVQRVEEALQWRRAA